MIKRVSKGLRRRIAEYKVKSNFPEKSFLEPEFHNCILSPKFVYRDDKSRYISSFINQEETDVTPWDKDEQSDTTRFAYTDSGMRLYSQSKKENWMCFFYKNTKERYAFSFDIEDHTGLDEIQVSFHCDSLKERYRFMIRNNKTAVFEVIKGGGFYRYVKQKECDIPINEKHNIKVVIDGNRYSLLVDNNPVLSVLDRKRLIKIGKDSKMVMIFYNRNGEINCDVSSIKLQY